MDLLSLVRAPLRAKFKCAVCGESAHVCVCGRPHFTVCWEHPGRNNWPGDVIGSQPDIYKGGRVIFEGKTFLYTLILWHPINLHAERGGHDEPQNRCLWLCGSTAVCSQRFFRALDHEWGEFIFWNNRTSSHLTPTTVYLFYKRSFLFHSIFQIK